MLLPLLQLMRFVQRTEGVDAARKVFLAATKSPACTYHVFVASARLELAANKDAKVRACAHSSCATWPFACF